MYKELSNKNFKIIERGDSVLYVIGGFDTQEDLADEISNLQNDDIDVQGVLEAETNSEGEITGDVNPVDEFDNSEFDNSETASENNDINEATPCLLYTSPSPRD